MVKVVVLLLALNNLVFVELKGRAGQIAAAGIADELVLVHQVYFPLVEGPVRLDIVDLLFVLLVLDVDARDLRGFIHSLAALGFAGRLLVLR